MCVSSSPGLGQREGRIPDHLMPEEFSRAFPSQVREPPGQSEGCSVGRGDTTRVQAGPRSGREPPPDPEDLLASAFASGH